MPFEYQPVEEPYVALTRKIAGSQWQSSWLVDPETSDCLFFTGRDPLDPTMPSEYCLLTNQRQDQWHVVILESGKVPASFVDALRPAGQPRPACLVTLSTARTGLTSEQFPHQTLLQALAALYRTEHLDVEYISSWSDVYEAQREGWRRAANERDARHAPEPAGSAPPPTTAPTPVTPQPAPPVAPQPRQAQAKSAGPRKFRYRAPQRRNFLRIMTSLLLSFTGCMIVLSIPPELPFTSQLILTPGEVFALLGIFLLLIMGSLLFHTNARLKQGPVEQTIDFFDFWMLAPAQSSRNIACLLIPYPAISAVYFQRNFGKEVVVLESTVGNLRFAAAGFVDDADYQKFKIELVQMTDSWAASRSLWAQVSTKRWMR